MGLFRLILLAALVVLAVRVYKKVSLALNQRSRPRSIPREPPGPEPSGRAPWQVLGVSPDATQREIRAAYQELIRQYHPDRVADLGPELREVAERRTKEINVAYARLKRPQR